MAVKWPSGVNKKFYGLSTGAQEDYVEVSFESGKIRRFRKGSRTRLQHSFNLNFMNKAEELAFWKWYDEELAGGTLSFEIPGILKADELKEYTFASVPTCDNGQYPKVLSLEVREE